MSEPGSLVNIEVFADVGCPFTHVGLRRFVQRRAASGRDDVVLAVRAWPLELVNGRPLDPDFIAEEAADLRAQVAPDLFAGIDPATFPGSSLPAMALTARAASVSPQRGEAVALAVRDALFERGEDVSRPEVLAPIAAAHGLDAEGVTTDHEAVLADYAAGRARGVIGSPHFFTPGDDWFCPGLRIHRDDAGHLHIAADLDRFEAFLDACFA